MCYAPKQHACIHSNSGLLVEVNLVAAFTAATMTAAFDFLSSAALSIQHSFPKQMQIKDMDGKQPRIATATRDGHSHICWSHSLGRQLTIRPLQYDSLFLVLLPAYSRDTQMLSHYLYLNCPAITCVLCD